jgi:hypothetical protein
METVWGGMDWIDLAQDMDKQQTGMNTVMSLQVPKDVGKFFE